MNMRYEPPIRKGEELKVKIENLGTKQDGIVRINKFILIVKQPVMVGFTYKIRVTKSGEKYAFGEVIR